MKALAYILIILPSLSFSQVSSPVNWEGLAKRLDRNQYQLNFTCSVSPGWHVYAAGDKEAGVEAPTLQWNNTNITALGNLNLTQATQIIKDEIFQKRLQVLTGQTAFSQNIIINGTIPSQLNLSVSCFASNGKEFKTLSQELNIKLEGGTENNYADQIILSGLDINKPLNSCGEQQQKDGSLLITFLLGILGGLVALLTPCVFPMIPVTVSFFTSRSNNRRDAVNNGLLYGACISLVYVLASIPFHLVGGVSPQLFNTVSTNAWVNLSFFIVFILFAISLFGGFNLALPSSLSNLAGSKGRLTSIAGIFFMALTLAVVSFSCTGPILGSLLVGSLSSSGAWQLTAGMAGFGLALGLPFALFAIFPQWLQRLPKSGEWMNVVKKSLGFIELALALKFLSNADLVEHWGILKRETFIGLWITLAMGLSLYLFGIFGKQKQFQPSPVLRVASPKPRRKISGARFTFAVLTLIFALYLVPGITPSAYAKLSLLSGFPPPLSYSIYGNAQSKYKASPSHVVNDLDKAIVLAKQEGKPILIDFTGWACVNCRKMEENVWSEPSIKKLLENKFILVSLYVDDRGKLGESFTYKKGEEEKQIETIGNKYAMMESANFKQVSQPLYAIITPDHKLLNNPVGYTPSVSKYRQWLECGYEGFRGSASE